MGRRSTSALVLCAALVAAAPVRAEQPGVPIRLPAGRLGDALRSLSVQARAGLLFSPDIADRHGPEVVGTMSVEQALRRLLAGSGLEFQRSDGGSFFVRPAPPVERAPPVPEILVLGHRSQNVDIRRTENDIQPYRVDSSQDILSSNADSIDAYLRERLPSDAQLGSVLQGSLLGDNRSQINLHGLGADQTLVLVDGARMPSSPQQGLLSSFLASNQPDLNGIPLIAIDRVESLTAAAGGIYGPGATGGVVNVVLKRDYRGADLSVTNGLSDRGDAPYRRVEGRIGFTPDHGRTDVMLTFSRATIAGLRMGDRSYSADARRLEAAQWDPSTLLSDPPANAIIIRSGLLDDLTLKSGFGGGSLGTNFTSLPTGYAGIQSDGGAALLRGAGQFPVSLSPDAQGTQRSLVGDARTTSLLVNVRHRFGDAVELFADFVAYQNDGRSVIQLLQNSGIIFSFAPDNPFQQTIALSFPTPGFQIVSDSRLRTARLSTGAIVRLPYGWRANAGYNIGWVRTALRLHGSMLNSDFATALAFGQSGALGEPTPNPFGAWDDFVAAMQAYKTDIDERAVRYDHLRDASLRLAGPLFHTAAGPVGLTLLAERRRESIPQTIAGEGQPGATLLPIPGYAQTVTSVYGELRAPILPRDAHVPLLAGLETQLTIRNDIIRTMLPTAPLFGVPAGFTARQAPTVFTAGFKTFPQEHLMLRASVSTGALPPPPAEFLGYSLVLNSSSTPDPERGGRIIGSEGAFTYHYGGSQATKPMRAQTLAVGLVLNPDAGRRVRVSLDYTHTRLTDGAITPPASYLLQNESRYADRITRAPLTAADVAAGFTGGVITDFDARYVSTGRIVSDALDIDAEYNVAIGASSRVRLYGSATWTRGLDVADSAHDLSVRAAGFVDGPLRWRGNAGFDWSRGPLGIGINGQYYTHYFEATAPDSSIAAAERASLDVPGIRIPAQFYLDFSIAYRFDLAKRAGSARSVDVRFGIEDLLDHAPPTTINNIPGYSYYGDPRRRRFELTVATHL